MKLTITKIKPKLPKRRAKTGCGKLRNVLKIRKVKVRTILKKQAEKEHNIPIDIIRTEKPENSNYKPGKNAINPFLFMDAGLRFIAVYLIFALSFFNLLLPWRVSASFSVPGIITGNSIEIGILDFSLSTPTKGFVLEDEKDDSDHNEEREKDTEKESSENKTKDSAKDKIKYGDSATREIVIKNKGTIPFRYAPSVNIAGGSNDLCGVLRLQAKFRDEVRYDGDLMDFDLETDPAIISVSGKNTWDFIVTLPANGKKHGEGRNKEDLNGDRSCRFNFVFSAWQLDLDSDQGFSLKKEIRNVLKLNPEKKHEDDDDKEDRSLSRVSNVIAESVESVNINGIGGVGGLQNVNSLAGQMADDLQRDFASDVRDPGNGHDSDKTNDKNPADDSTNNDSGGAIDAVDIGNTSSDEVLKPLDELIAEIETNVADLDESVEFRKADQDNADHVADSVSFPVPEPVFEPTPSIEPQASPQPADQVVIEVQADVTPQPSPPGNSEESSAGEVQIVVSLPDSANSTPQENSSEEKSQVPAPESEAKQAALPEEQNPSPATPEVAVSD